MKNRRIVGCLVAGKGFKEHPEYGAITAQFVEEYENGEFSQEYFETDRGYRIDTRCVFEAKALHIGHYAVK